MQSANTKIKYKCMQSCGKMEIKFKQNSMLMYNNNIINNIRGAK